MLRITELKPPLKVVSIVEDTYEKAMKSSYLAIENGADVIEQRADWQKNARDGIRVVEDLDFPTIFTCMPEQEGGKFRGCKNDRWEILGEAATCSTVSLEHKYVPDNVINDIRSYSEVILMYHTDRMLTLSETIELVKEMEPKADIVKIVPTANSYLDLTTWRQNTKWMKENMKKPYISLAMGSEGKPSRFETFDYDGAIITFCCRDETLRARPEQPTLAEMTEYFERKGYR